MHTYFQSSIEIHIFPIQVSLYLKTTLKLFLSIETISSPVSQVSRSIIFCFYFTKDSL